MLTHSYYEEDPRVRREAESLVAALVAHGFGVQEIRPERADLETLFLQLTSTEAPACASS